MSLFSKIFSFQDDHRRHKLSLHSKWFKFLWLLIWTSCCTPVTQGRYRCMLKDFIRLGNSCYFLSSEIASWQEAHFRCRDRGSQLAVLASQYEDTTLRSYLERPEFAQLGRWIGGMLAAGKWMWAAQGIEIDNEKSFVDTNVYNMGNSDRWMCLFMDPINRYRWSNEDCMRQFHYICEAPLAKETNSSAIDDASPAGSSSSDATTAATTTANQENNGRATSTSEPVTDPVNNRYSYISAHSVAAADWTTNNNSNSDSVSGESEEDHGSDSSEHGSSQDSQSVEE